MHNVCVCVRVACVCVCKCMHVRACERERDRERESSAPSVGSGIPVHLDPYQYTVPRQPVLEHSVLPTRTASPSSKDPWKAVLRHLRTVSAGKIRGRLSYVTCRWTVFVPMVLLTITSTVRLAGGLVVRRPPEL